MIGRVLGVTMALAVASGATAQDRGGMSADPGDRPGMPMVEGGRFEADPDAAGYQATQRFTKWLRRNGNPRILLFWNVALTDESSTRNRLRLRSETVTDAGPGRLTTTQDAVVEAERTTGGPAAAIDRVDTDVLEDGYVQSFVDAGANLADRAALMRKVSTERGRDDRSDLQFIEALAMEQGIDYVIEVLPDYQPASPTGMTFGVRILHVPSARVVGRFRSNGQPVAGPERLVARAGGFVRERDDRINPTTIAGTLATETMERFR